MIQLDRPCMHYFLLVVCSYYVTIWNHFRGITIPYTVYITVTLKSQFCFDTTVEITYQTFKFTCKHIEANRCYTFFNTRFRKVLNILDDF